MSDRIRIDWDTYPRREHFRYFCEYANPYVGTTCEVDITAFLTRVRADARPFFLTFLWHVARAANAVPEFRQRIEDGGIVQYACCPTSHTLPMEDGTYRYCTLRTDMPLKTFLPYAKAEQDCAKIRCSISETAQEALSLLFISSVPWFSFTALVQPTPMPADSNPRITWGKYHTVGDRVLIPVAVLCNHALIDGRHIALFYQELERSLDSLE